MAFGVFNEPDVVRQLVCEGQCNTPRAVSTYDDLGFQSPMTNPEVRLRMIDLGSKLIHTPHKHLYTDQYECMDCGHRRVF